MNASNLESVIVHLRSAAMRLQSENHYQWGHMGFCNCGYLAQEISGKQAQDIHKSALQKPGDWRDQLREYCPGSGLPMDEIIEIMEGAGFSVQDLINLERLDDGRVLQRIGRGSLSHNRKQDVIDYLNAWASICEEEWLHSAKLPRLKSELLSV
jgi:hypothetical protein